MNAFKKRIYHLVEKGAHGSSINLAFDYFIIIMIALSIVSMLLETFSSVRESFGTYLHTFDVFSIVVFSIEYLMRIYVSDITNPSSSRIKSIFKFIFSFYGLVDLLAILPFYLPFIIKMDLRFIRVLRLMRFFRALKINRYNGSLDILIETIKARKQELYITLFVTLLILLTASFAIYYIENGVQPEVFSNIYTCFWWTISTLTFTNYDNIHPITWLGKFTGVFIQIFWLGLIAIQTGLLSSGFIDKIKDKKSCKKVCPHCGKSLE